MKRHNNIYAKIYDLQNLYLAEATARKRKKHKKAIHEFDLDKPSKLMHLQSMLINKSYKTSPYTTFIIKEPKPREIYRLPYFPDRVLQHAVMILLRPIFISTFTADTYSCIPSRGIHAAGRAVKRALNADYAGGGGGAIPAIVLN